ncbi:MAG: hypothetical protein ACO1RT_06470 [Planctomycetaceae bacterium]
MPAPAKTPPPQNPLDDSPSSHLTPTLLTVAAVTTVVGFAALFATWFRASIDPGIATLQIAQRQFVLGHFKTAADLAQQATLGPDAPEDAVVLREYVIGAGLANEALTLSDAKQRRADLHVAIPHLETASRAWPGGREDEGDQLLGMALFQVGDYAAAISPLRKCIDRNPTVRKKLIPTLATCYLHGEKDAAREAIALLDELDPESLTLPGLRDEIEALRAQCLWRLSRFAEARKVLGEIQQRISSNLVDADPAAVLMATKVNLHLAIVDVSEAMERFGKGSSTDVAPRPEAIKFLAPAMERLAILRRDASPEVASQASLWAARGYACAGQPSESLGLLSVVRQQQPFDGANIAAGIEEIEWLANAGRGEESLQTVRYLLREIGSEQDFDGSRIDLTSFRRRLVAALQTLRQKERFEHCVAIARALPTLLPAADAYFEEAITHQQAAERSLTAARTPTGDLRPAELAAAKKSYRAAGDAFVASAKLRFDTDAYCTTLWSAIDAYQSCGQFALCVDLLDDYLRYEDRRRQPRALLALGKARLAIGETEPALIPLETCIAEFPRDPLRYDARLYAAFAHAEAQRFTEAKALLDANLTDGGLTPESEIWRESLFTLGELLFRQGHEAHLLWDLAPPPPDPAHQASMANLREKQPLLDEAILRLREAATRYWPDPRAKYAAYLQARAHKMAAVWPLLQADSADTLDAAKRQLRQQADQHLTAALAGFVALRQDMATGEEEQPLSETQRAMLRNCYVAEADTLFDLKRYEEASDAFRAVSLRYMNEPPALEAMLGQSRCLHQLKRDREARLVIRQAAVVLSRIPPDADDEFLKTSRYDRKRWEELLTWLDSGPLPEDSDA